MARPGITRKVDSRTVIDATGINLSNSPTSIIQEGFPQGNQALAELSIRIKGAIGVSGGSSPTRVTDGEKLFLRALTVETDNHGKIVDSMEGLLLNRMLQYEWGTLLDSSQVSSTPADADTFSHGIVLPLVLPNGVRPYDTILDMVKSRPKVTAQYGIRSDIFGYTGGSPVVKSVTQSIEAKVLPTPINEGVNADGTPNVELSELPLLQRSWEMRIEPITQTQTRFQIPLPYSDRIWRRLFITQRDGSTRGELSTVIADTAEVSLVVNNQEIINRTTFGDIRARNKSEYGLESLPTGVAVLDFDLDQRESINDMLSTLDKNTGNAYLYIDVTAVSNGQVWLGYDCLKKIPQAAQRLS